MSKIHQKSLILLEGKQCRINNTMTNGYELFYLVIVLQEEIKNNMQITTAKFNTLTTRDRLNMLPGIWVRCRKGNLQINFQSEWKDWDGEWINIENEKVEIKDLQEGDEILVASGSGLRYLKVLKESISI